MNLQVSPFYGWGWFDGGGNVVGVPAPFELDAEIIEAGEPFHVALGRVSDVPGHPLAGLWILLAQRHLPFDNQCNLWAFAERPTVPKIPEPLPSKPTLTGFAVAELLPT
jgi:hypothetical protein